jgi:protein Tex
MSTVMTLPDIPGIIAKKLNAEKSHVKNIVELHKDGATIPFVSRYRKDQTGNMDEVQVTQVYDAIKYYNELFERKAFILEEIEKKGKLTPELREKIEKCLDAKKLEDLYLPYKETKKSKAEQAREAGLEPLALMLLSPTDLGDPLKKAGELLNPEKKFDTVAKVIEGALNIIAQKVIESVNLMDVFLKNAFENGNFTSKKKKGYEGEELRFEDYYDYTEELSRLKNPRNTHRFLAIKRGENLKVLSTKIELDDDKNIEILRKSFIKENYFYEDYIIQAVEMAYKQYLRPALDTRINQELTDTAENEAIDVFTRNLEAALLAPPLPYKNVLGLDPGLRTGVKVAILDKDGTFKGNFVLNITSERQVKEGADKLVKVIKEFDIGAIAIGNGTGSRETLQFVNTVLTRDKIKIIVSVVNESGASVYSASKIAREEFPDLDLTVRGAISIGRRLQNPLAELVKIDPKSIGVGQYQHDVNQKKLGEALTRVVEFCVNKVGVDINTASYSILTYISGLTDKTAKNIVEHRSGNGFFKSRSEIKKVKGIGPKAFEQCAGFLMIREGKNPLDNTRVHPESYPIVDQIAKNHKMTVDLVIGNKFLLKNIDPSKYVTDTYQEHNLKALIDDLMNPGLDPRKEFKNIEYKEGVETVSDVKEGMEFEGRVTNVTNFGAFIDVGVHQDGLCHISQMADRFVKDPNEIVSVGDIVNVKVIGIDYQKKRISLKII